MKKQVRNVLMTAAAIGSVMSPALAWSKVNVSDFSKSAQQTQTPKAPQAPKQPQTPQTPKAPQAPQPQQTPKAPQTSQQQTPQPPKTPQAPQQPTPPQQSQTPTGPKGNSPQPTGQNLGFDPIIKIDTIAPKSATKNTVSFHNGLFLDDADGGKYQVCGRVKKAQDLQLNNRGKAVIEVDGKFYDLTVIPPAANGDYKFCGDVTLEDVNADLSRRADKKNVLTNLFKNFEVNLRNKKGQKASERFTIVNSASRDMHDTVHVDEVELLLTNNSEMEGDTFNDYISHAANDFVVSNEDMFESKLASAYSSVAGSTCDMATLYENLNDKADWWAELLLEIVGVAYDITTDWDQDERMFLCFDSLTIGGSNLSITTGDLASDMFVIGGHLTNVDVRFNFDHTSNGYFTGYDKLEEGTLVVRLGKVSVGGGMGNLDISAGLFTGLLDMDSITITQVDSWWEDWYVNEVWYEGEDSGMSEADDLIEDALEGFTTKDIEAKEINQEMEQDIDLTFVQDSEMFELILGEVELESPSLITDVYTKQDEFRTTENGAFTAYQAHELGVAIDDDLLNHALFFKVKEGAFDPEPQTKTLEDGSTITMEFEAPVAPVVSFDGEEAYALRMELANASLKITSSKTPEPMRYSLDLNLVLEMRQDSADYVDIIVKKAEINTVALRGAPMPDKVLSKVMTSEINKMVNTLEAELKAQIETQLNTVFESMPMDICTDVESFGANGSGDYLAVGLNLDWSESISKTDTCFKKTSQTGSGSSGDLNNSVDLNECDEDVEECAADDIPPKTYYDDDTTYEP